MARNDFSSNYLMHHGILGMKWGIRNYQNKDGTLTDAGRARYGVGEGKGVKDISSAKGIKRRLNDLDKAIARNKAKRGKALAKVNKKNWNSQNAKNATKAEKHTEMIKKGEEETQRLLKKAAEKGYEVSSKTTLRNVSSGAEIIGRTLLTSAIASLVLAPFGRAAFIPNNSSVPGKKYNVKDSKEETARKEAKAKYKEAEKKYKDYESRESFNSKKWNEEKSEKLYQDMVNKRNDYKKSSSSKSSGLSEKTIKSRVEYAKRTGNFDMEFLERVDRYVDEENHSQAAMLKGYEEYLKEHGDEFYKKK